MGSLINAFFLTTQLLGFLLSVESDLCSILKGADISTVCPGDSGYSAASKAHNLRFTFEPAAITYPSTAAEVSSIISIGAASNVKVVARSGGHSYIANGLGGQDGSLVIDMSKMTSITIDSSANTAIIDSGNRLGIVALTLNAAGRALPHGICPYVGIGGHTAFGGYGFTSRMWGLALDPIFAVNAVLANGTIIRATKDTYPDIFWALRGAGSSFAITTSIEVNTFAAPSYAIIMVYTWNDVDYKSAAQYLDSFQRFSLSGPPAQWAGELLVTKGTQKGQVTIVMRGGWYGDKAGATPAVQPFLNMMPAPNSACLYGNGTYIDTVAYLARGHGPLNTTTAPDSTDTFYTKSLMTPGNDPMTLDASTAFMKYLANEGFGSDTDWLVEIALYGGPNSAIAAIPENATAFSGRNTLLGFQLYAASPDHEPPYPGDALDFVDGMLTSVTSNMPPDWNWGAYTDWLDNRLENWQNLYYKENYPRLQLIKTEFDPLNIFSFPTSIQELL